MLLKHLIWQEIQTALAATVFTVLVWIYAEGETVQKQELRLNIQFVPPPGQALIIRPVQPPVLAPLTVHVLCANAQWNEVEKWQSKPFDLQLSADNTNQQHEVTVDLVGRLRSDKRFKDRGVEVSDVRGDSNPTLYVEPVVARTVNVTPDTGALDLQGQATVTPEKVTVSVPASQAAILDQLRVVARLDPGDLDVTRLTDGQQIARDVHLTLADAAGLRDWQVAPDHAQVTLTVRRPLQNLTLSAVPVHVMFMSQADTARYSVTIPVEDQLLSLVLTGPKGSLDRLREHTGSDSPLLAFVRLSTEDLDKRITTKPVDILGLPPGVIVTGPATLPAVHLQIVPKTP